MSAENPTSVKVPVGCWSVTATGYSRCPVAGCGHLEPALVGGLAERQADHERAAHGLVADPGAAPG